MRASLVRLVRLVRLFWLLCAAASIAAACGSVPLVPLPSVPDPSHSRQDDPSPDAEPAEPADPPAEVLLFAEVAREHRERERARRASRPWLRGSTHVHTLYSGDSRTRPGAVVKWYADRGYDFIVITDHNRVTDRVSAELGADKLIVIEGVELTNNPPACDPPPPEPTGKCRVHVNGLFVSKFPPNQAGQRPAPIDWRARGTIARLDLYQAALTKARELGGLAQLNHPTWHWGVDGPLATELAARGLRFIEIANVAFARWNSGADGHAGTEAIWDAALAAGHRLWGVASDDAHHYYDIEQVKAAGGALYPPGGGFVMVRAERDPAAIRRAMERGDFYASTGILLDRIEVTETELVIEVAPAERRGVAIEFISAGSVVKKTVAGNSARFPLGQVAGSYVRARVTAGDGSRAWSQPVFVD